MRSSAPDLLYWSCSDVLQFVYAATLVYDLTKSSGLISLFFFFFHISTVFSSRACQTTMYTDTIRITPKRSRLSMARLLAAPRQRLPCIATTSCSLRTSVTVDSFSVCVIRWPFSTVGELDLLLFCLWMCSGDA